MKVLRFLISSSVNSLVQKIIDYLIDAGHFVDLYSLYEKDNILWKNKYKYNFSILNSDQIQLRKFDYIIDFSDKINVSNSYNINFNFDLLSKFPSLSVVVEKNKKHSCINVSELSLIDKFSSPVDNYNYIVEIAVEAFIDSVIYLLRLGQDDLVFKDNYSGTMVSSLFYYKEMLNLLDEYYNSFDNNENMFFIQNIINSNPKNMEYLNLEFNIDQNFNINQNDLEIIITYLLVLLNSKKDAIYSYDLKLPKGDCISKFIEVKASNFYKDLCIQYKNEIYDIVENEFYFGVTLLNSHLKPRIILSYDHDISDNLYDFYLNYNPRNNQLNLRYKKDLYFFDSCKPLLEKFFSNYNQFIAEEKNLSDLLILPPDYIDKLTLDWNSSGKKYPRDKTIHQFFEEQVERTPDNIALVFADRHLTYRELNERSNQLAHYLKENYVIKSDDFIALCLDRSEYMLISILAVLKAGAAYVPMDISYPEERIKYILEDTSAKVVLTNAAYASKFKETIIVEELDLASQSKINLNSSTKSEDLAYVIYTSGTTGKPKGVLQLHGNVHRLFTATNHLYQFNDKDIWTLFHSYVFDFTVWEIWGALFYGAKLVIPSREQVGDTEIFYDLCKQEGVTILNQTPNAFYQFIDIAINKQHKLDQLRYVIFGGEALNISQLEDWFDIYGYDHPKLINMYGITETTVHVTYKEIKEADIGKNSYIGKAIDDLEIYVLDTSLHPLPIGAIGELYVGGAGLARGYLNRPDLTAEKFIDSPFNRGEKLYKTGDLVRWLKDGSLEYIGRNDFQVKIRGFRIELGEIETALSSYSQIKQSVVLVKENKQGMKYLVGYYTADKELDQEDIFNYLEQHLPSYMIPNQLISLNSFPLTLNGKLNKNALPDSDFIGDKDSYIAPRNDMEVSLCKIWSEVLKIDENKIGIQDNFFRLGGDSILAIKLTVKINRELSFVITVAEIFKHITIEQLATYLSMQHNTYECLIEKSNVTRAEEQLLSFAQERLWFIDHYEGGTNAYIVPLIFKLKKTTNTEKLESAIKSIIIRHEILRTVIKQDNNGDCYQSLLNENSFKVTKISLENKDLLNHQLKKDAHYIFNLNNEHPIKVCFYTFAKEIFLSIMVHHIAFDGWSIDIFLKELEDYYFDKPIPKLDIQYKDFALWQRNFLSGEKLNKDLVFWKERLVGYEPLSLVTDRPRPKEIEYQGKDYDFVISEEISIALREIAKDLKVSLYSVVLSAYYLMLRVYSNNQNDIVIGAPVAGRNITKIENLIGFFINLFVVRAKISPQNTIDNFIQKVSREVISAQLHQDLPFEKLVEELKIEKDTSRHPIFQVMFAVQSFGEGIKYSKMLETYSTKENIYSMARFDLSTIIDDSNIVLKGSFNYAISIYDEKTIIGFTETYLLILKQFVECKNKLNSIRIDELSYLDSIQYNQVIKSWNNTFKEYPKDKTIAQLFEEQVIKTPNNIALISKNIKYSYSELNERSNQLANYLRKNYDIKPDDLIIFCLDRSEYILIAILGILKAGAAYVPVDPSYPDERINYILHDTKSVIVMTNSIYKERFENAIAIEEIELSIEAKDNPQAITKSNNIAYVIYTSGTTGNPKGVMIEHKAVANYIDNVKHHILMSEVDIVDYSTNIGFDLTVTTTICALCLGAKIAIYSQKLQDVESYKSHLITKEVTLVKLVPSYFELLVDTICSSQINKIILGGEKLDSSIINRVRDLNPQNNLVIYDEYGPTETTVGACISQVYPKYNLTIGNLYNNFKAYVLDQNLCALPVGAIGEMYIGGAGLARGYLNLEKISTEKFIMNPYEVGEKIYKTGDLVRWLSTGELEYIGRNDSQVKIRGYRVELSEIESELIKHQNILKAVVIVKADNMSPARLVAYIVTNILEITANDVKEFLLKRMPNYMVPQYFVFLEQIPLTINGKIDYRLLPDPNFVVAEENNYIAPRSNIEVSLAQIWSELLRIPEDKIGVQDDFFRLGGNSILAIKLVFKINKSLESLVKVAEIFSFNTIEKLAIHIEELASDNKKGTTYEY